MFANNKANVIHLCRGHAPADQIPIAAAFETQFFCSFNHNLIKERCS